jgi:hypothetical protein
MKRETSRELNELGQRVEGWREQHGGRGSPVPDELWNAAVEAARIDGVWATAQALHFNYTRLRERVDRAKGMEGGGGKAPFSLATTADAKERGPVPRRTSGKQVRDSGAGNGRPPFIALEMGRLSGPRAAVIDLMNRRGDRMRVEVPDGIDVLGLVDRFGRWAP